MEFENSHQLQVEHFSRAALDEIRSGRSNEEVNSLRDSMTAQIERWVQTPGVEVPWVLRAVRILADLHDRRGDNQRAFGCVSAIGSADEIESSISGSQAGSNEVGTERSIERQWCLLQAATCLHRLGKTEDSERFVRTALLRLSNQWSPESLELKIRANYIMGRILQTSGRPELSEEFLGTALECCHAWVASGVHSATAAGYARYQAAVVLSALARSALAKNELARAGRQLLLAATMLRDTDDRVARAYVTFLSGCVKRQTNQLSDATRLLSEARDEFLDLKHTRLFNRCSLELAQSFYNSDDFESLRTVLARWNKDRNRLGDHYADHNQASGRWEAARKLLLARIHLKQNNLSEAEKEATGAREHLERSHSKSLPRVWDDLAVAYAILAETALKQGRPDLCKSLVTQGLTVRDGMPSSDTADHAWLLMLAAEAHLKTNRAGDLDRAYRYVRDCKNLTIENEFIRQRFANLLRSLDFFIAHDESEKLKYAEWDLLLRRFLLRRAESVHPGASAERLAEVLGVSKQTVYNWREDFRRKDTTE